MCAVTVSLQVGLLPALLGEPLSPGRWRCLPRTQTGAEVWRGSLSPHTCCGVDQVSGLLGGGAWRTSPKKSQVTSLGGDPWRCEGRPHLGLG